MSTERKSVPPSPRLAGLTMTSSNAVPIAGAAPVSVTSSPSLSRRVSQHIAPPMHPRSPSMSSSILGLAENTGAGTGPVGPLRHPRPLTAADIFAELEREQEAAVNRLTRELDHLRQQTASVASTTSSASANVIDPADPHGLPGARSRNRSSSTLSSRSFVGGALPMTSVTGIAPSREMAAPSRPTVESHRTHSGREHSTRSRGPSGTASPLLSSSFQQQESPMSSFHPQFQSQSRRVSQAPPNAPNHPTNAASLSVAGSSRRGSLSGNNGAARYEEVSFHRAELENAKRENEALRRRVRELEQALREHRRAETGSPNESLGSISNLTTQLQATSIVDGDATR